MLIKSLVLLMAPYRGAAHYNHYETIKYLIRLYLNQTGQVRDRLVRQKVPYNTHWRKKRNLQETFVTSHLRQYQSLLNLNFDI